ncbi:flagellar transcriptional regulator FlhD [Nitrogeniibacter mangrovi]|uniref:Flagellar transcriptional regulator FlhD n=1 Tax=Nitrogeniibacter mangrovi TaxID=2016596 RepID=A0A6C1B3P6_9RHOO|nr:flagellar transcriptional regulator FlhD [Nitrogeniibacter mangrovi]QID18282.1 flagellar transcriptional regulator FlhD [Nitrogeniibacter mangrovi]
MKSMDMQEEIRELNLAYLMLAQQMVREDREEAMFRLGISAEVAELIEGLSTSQIARMAGQQMVLCRFRFDDAALVGMLTGKGRDAATSSLHAAIVAAAQPVQNLA